MTMLLLSSEAEAWSQRSTPKEVPVHSVSPLTNGCPNVRFGKTSLQISSSEKKGRQDGAACQLQPLHCPRCRREDQPPAAGVSGCTTNVVHLSQQKGENGHARPRHLLPGPETASEEEGQVHVKVRKRGKNNSRVAQDDTYTHTNLTHISHHTNAVSPQLMLGSGRQAAAGADELYSRQ